jgi:hypothetical protein
MKAVILYWSPRSPSCTTWLSTADSRMIEVAYYWISEMPWRSFISVCGDR